MIDFLTAVSQHREAADLLGGIFLLGLMLVFAGAAAIIRAWKGRQ